MKAVLGLAIIVVLISSYTISTLMEKATEALKRNKYNTLNSITSEITVIRFYLDDLRFSYS